MTRQEFFDRIAAHRPELARAGGSRLGVFGSVARDEAGPESDVDILVEFERTYTSSPHCVNVWPKSWAGISTSRRLGR